VSLSQTSVLVATELLTGPSRPDPLAETTHIRFHMLSARNRSRLVERLLPRGERRLTVDEKLAGNQLANFGAFLRARWRQNDWIWGRLDAARSLVDILTAPDPETSSEFGTGGDAAGRVDWTALARLAGVSSNAARGEVTDALVTLLHERILREELPLLRGLGGGPPSQERLDRNEYLTGEVDGKAVLPLLRTGQETVASALVKDPLRLGIALRLLDLGALGWTSGSARAAAHGISGGGAAGAAGGWPTG
jgi:hypothetical protein